MKYEIRAKIKFAFGEIILAKFIASEYIRGRKRLRRSEHYSELMALIFFHFLHRYSPTPPKRLETFSATAAAPFCHFPFFLLIQLPVTSTHKFRYNGTEKADIKMRIYCLDTCTREYIYTV